MKCPICKREVKFDDPFMPFCSDRCKDIDLGNWATGKYVIPGDEVPEEELSSLESPRRSSVQSDEED